MSKKDMTSYKLALKAYLSKLNLVQKLRAYGRVVGVARPAAKNKDALIQDIIAIKVGELEPIEPSKRGAPVLDGEVDPKIIEDVEKLDIMYLSGVESQFEAGFKAPETKVPPLDLQKAYAEMIEKHKSVLRVENPLASEYREDGTRKVHKGQLTTLNSIPLLLPLDCTDSEEKFVCPMDFIRQYDLREGDILTCHAQKGSNFYVATNILTVNEVELGALNRCRFESAPVCEPFRRINLYGEAFSSVSSKFFQWLVPFGKGQRGIIISSPKSGKTRLLQEVLHAASKLNGNLVVLAMLADQSPETVAAYQKIIEKDNLVYTTYEDEPDRQVFVAEYMLRRAKRLAESGRDVLLGVDSFNALARAFNETEESVGGRRHPCGLESKTLLFLKKYFGAGRCLEAGGSLTIIGTASVSTGDPADDMIVHELSEVSNLEVKLSETLAYKRIFPALEPSLVQVKQNDTLQSYDEKSLDYLLRNQFASERKPEFLLRILEQSDSYSEFVDNIRKALK